MIEWLGIGHLFELSGAEAIAGFFTPLAIFALFFLAQGKTAMPATGSHVESNIIQRSETGATGSPTLRRTLGVWVLWSPTGTSSQPIRMKKRVG